MEKIKSYLDQQQEQEDHAVSILDNLIPTPDSIWGDISDDQIFDPTDATLRVIWERSRKDDARFQRVVGRARGKMEMVLLVRAVMWKAEAAKVEGLMEEELRMAGIEIARNTDLVSATNAAVFRLLSNEEGEQELNKFRVSRAAKAMKGIEIICGEEGITLDLASAGDLLLRVSKESRDALCRLADQRSAPVAANPPAVSAPDDTDTGAEEPVGQVIEAPPVIPDLIAEHEVLGRVRFETDALREGELHLVAVTREGQDLVLRGPVYSGDEARSLIEKALAG